MEVLGGSISIDVLTDDNLADILVHLDAVSVLRCRAVCKSWRRIATDRSFLAAHAAGRPREMIIEIETNGYVYARSTVPLPPTDADLDTTTAGGGDGRRHHRYLFDTRETPADGDGISSAFTLQASLDGLLLLKQWRSGAPITSDFDTFTYVVCNPVTRRWAILPSPVPRRRHACDFRAAVACGFYLHASSGDGEYRLLVHCVVRDWPGDMHWKHYYYCVLSVGSALPRRLPHAPPTDRLVIPHYDDPVSYHGTLHWLSGHPQGRTTGKMLAFDTVSETFRLMPRPPEGPAPAEAMSDLLVLDGELSVATIYKNGNDAMLDVWALQDYEAAEKWTLRHRLNVQRPPRSASIIMAMGNAPHDGSSSAILIGCPRTREVMVYSLKDNKVRKEIDFGGFATCFRVFSESLVPHAFLDSPDTVPLKFSNTLFNESMAARRA